ncbi:MAG: hypothetical protein R3A48_24440 [Polyangiales bacterium]
MHLDTLQALARALIALCLAAAIARTAWRGACALVPEGPGRASAAVTLGAAAVTLGTHALLGAGAFSALGCAALAAALALLARALPPGAAWRLAAPSRVTLAAALPAALAVGWRWLRTSVSPCLAPDSMTYHLYRAARWAQLGHDAPEDWPDAAGYYEFFPTGAELFWAHGLALTGEDLCVATVGAALLAAVALAAWDLARAWDVPAERAPLVAVAVVTLPAAVSVAMTGYADVWTLATFLLAASHARLATRDERGVHGALCVVAAALHLQAKPSGLPAAAALGALGLWAMTRDKSLGRKGLWLSLAGATLVAAPTLARSLAARGSPLYPLSVGSALPGNPQLAALLAGRFSPGAREPSLVEALRAFTLGLPGMDLDPPGWGVAWLVAAPLAAFSVVRAGERGRDRAVAAVTLGAALAGVAALGRDEARELRTAFLPFSPRLFLPLPATLLVLGARVGGARSRPLWVALALSGAALSWSRAASPAVAAAALQAGPWALGSAVLVLAALRLRVAALTLASLALATSVSFVAVRAARARHRGAIVASMGGPPGARAFEVNPVGGAMRVFWRAGEALERDCARRTAAAFGWAPPGHRIFRYPLMGPGLRNEVVYVPVTRDGAVIDLAAEPLLAPRVDPAQWYARLRAAGVDHVVTSPPHPRELEWMLSRPSLFEPIAPEAAPLGVFRVRAAHRCPR